MGPNTSRRGALRAAGASVLVNLAGPVARAEALDAQIPLLDFFKSRFLGNLSLSPDGRHIAGIRTNANGIDNVVVHDIASGKTLVITNFSDASVSSLGWVNPNRLILSLIDRSRGSGEQMWGGLYAIDRDGGNYRALAHRTTLSEGSARLLPFGSTFVERVLTNGKTTDDIVVISSSFTTSRGKRDSNLYRVNTSNGRFVLLTSGGPKNVVDWVVDANATPRAAVSVSEDRTTVYLRGATEEPWRAIFTFEAHEGDKVVLPLAFDGAGQLLVSASAGSDYRAIYRYDTGKGRLDDEPLLAVKGFDIDQGLIFDAQKSLMGVSFEADRRMTVWFDDKRRALQDAVDKARPDHVNLLQFSAEGTGPVLVTSWSDRDPGRAFLFDPGKGRMEEVGKYRPWIQVDAMRPTRFFRFETSDGLSIPGQITLPRGNGPHPLVVLHYGGPWVRPIHWAWDPVVQFLASRGYAVYMPAPRASTGFGFRLFRAGWRQWGLGMQDDVTAGVEHLVKQGLVDRKRVGIIGASYGGYLAMMALVKEPSLFRCAVNWVGVTDPSYMLTVTWTDFNWIDEARYSTIRLVGDPERDAEQFKRTSPVQRASEISQPVLMAYGGLDRRVPLINGENMRAALRAKGRDPEWVVYPEEGHGWLKEANQLDFWSRVERFLAKNLAQTPA